MNKSINTKISPIVLSPIFNFRNVKNVSRDKKEKIPNIMHQTINFHTAKSSQLQLNKDQPIFTKRGQSRGHYNHRVLKSSRDVFGEKNEEKKPLFRGFEDNWANSLKII